MKRLFDPEPMFLPNALAAVRVITGLLMVYHGQEVFRPEVMKEYMKWDLFQSDVSRLMVYAGKTSELIAGTLLTLGLLTRIAAAMLAGVMLYITFAVGNGRFWYEDQHPFMFVLMAVIFFFAGPGTYSMDARLFSRRR